MNAPNLPEIAGEIIKALIVSQANAGLISSADAECVLALLGLRDG